VRTIFTAAFRRETYPARAGPSSLYKQRWLTIRNHVILAAQTPVAASD
jgi:hypothetical protein